MIEIMITMDKTVMQYIIMMMNKKKKKNKVIATKGIKKTCISKERSILFQERSFLLKHYLD